MTTPLGAGRGVAGVDMLISQLDAHLSSISFLQSGKVTLLEVATGIVVADREWTIDPLNPNAFTVKART